MAKFWRGEANPMFKGWASRNKRAYVLRFLAKRPEVREAYRVYNNAKRAGVVVPAAVCEDCGAAPAAGQSLHGHHEDYSQPLAVIWLCRPCHRARHSIRLEAS